MKLYWAPPACTICAIGMLEEAGLDYALERIDIRAAERFDAGRCVTLTAHRRAVPTAGR